MAAAAYGCVFDSCISSDFEIRRRPYHRNCGCALHRSGYIPQTVQCNAQVSYPMKRSWSGVSLEKATTSKNQSVSCRREEGDHYVD